MIFCLIPLCQMKLKERLQSFVGHLFNIEDWKEWYMDVDKIFVHPAYNETGNEYILSVYSDCQVRE